MIPRSRPGHVQKALNLLFLVVWILKLIYNIYEHFRGHTKGHTHNMTLCYVSDPLDSLLVKYCSANLI